jgi:hypothetical protein
VNQVVGLRTVRTCFGRETLPPWPRRCCRIMQMPPGFGPARCRFLPTTGLVVQFPRQGRRVRPRPVPIIIIIYHLQTKIDRPHSLARDALPVAGPLRQPCCL